jgi:hypothetical protein
MKCKPSSHTRDEVTSKAAEAMQFGLFGKGHTAQCRCSAGECSTENCDAVYVSDSDGRRIATLHGADVHAKQLDNGHLAVYRMPGAGRARTGDEMTTTELMLRIAAINRANAEFWKPKEAEE